MIQLSFQPALDPFHAVFRFLRLRPILVRVGEKPIDHMRILDFYLCFPFKVGHIRLRPTHRRYGKLRERYADRIPYGEQPGDRDIFARMKSMQLAAMDTLASNSLLDAERLRLSWVTATDSTPPEPLLSRVERANGAEADLMEFLGVLGADYDLSGPSGLKDRTGLMEHRYDAV